MNLSERVVLVDLDGTLCEGNSWTREECLKAAPKEEMIKKVNEAYQKNFIVIYTARRDENIPATLEWLRRNNVRFHAFSNQKTAGDVLIDDIAIRPEEFLYERPT